VHVAQRGGAQAWTARASYGVQGPNPHGRRELPGGATVLEPPLEEVAVVRRQTPGGAGGAAAPGAGPTLAVPSLTLSPGAALTRGDPLTASVAFSPVAGETLRVNSWRYPTPGHGTVVRPRSEPDFQRRWSGVMAVSGEIVVVYQVAPAGGRPGPAQAVRSAVTVADRAGPTWVSTPTLDPEGPFAGQPSPPQAFRQLGHHSTSSPALPRLTMTVIGAGPNTRLTFVSALAPGSYLSTPSIHPDLTAPASAFYRFHLDPSRLYFVPTTGPRVLVPLREYSGLSVGAGGALSFTVPSWEAFYKAHNVYRVSARAVSGGHEVVLAPALWRLASNAEHAPVRAADPAAVRSLLGISSGDPFGVSVTPLGRWSGFRLMQSPAILAGTRSHEYGHATHSHRANFTKMLRALDPERKIESVVAAPSRPVDFGALVTGWWTEINKPDHELVDEAASRAAERFVPAPGTMAGVNVDPASGASLGSVWNITGDGQMT
jgi:hypothetical protein